MTELRQLYSGCNPRPMRDLLRGGVERLPVGAMKFQCSLEEFLASVVS